MIINFNIKILHLIQRDAKATIRAFRQEHAELRKHFGFGNPVHHIKLPDMHELSLNRKGMFQIYFKLHTGFTGMYFFIVNKK